ncbi:hypothetical protein EV174_004699 [Coemansia sp. RSA 2320]|nr:hypothetical protein EV174_004699 [Coemansia sp. RSA 2320]
MEHFEKGVRYIYKEGEYADDMSSETLTQTDASPPELTIDKEGWEPGVLEKVLWDRRRSQTEQRQRRRGQERGLCGNIICNLSDVSESLHSSTSDGSSADTSSRSSAGSDCTSADTDSESDSNRSSASSSGSDAHRGVAQATSVNKALGSDNVGFKLLAKLGWQQGQGLGAAGDGIVEPIRLQTRFSTVRGASARGRRRGRFHSKGTERASLGIGRQKASGAQKPPPVANTETDTRLADDFESYRKQMSSAYKHSSSTQRHLHRDKPQDTP